MSHLPSSLRELNVSNVYLYVGDAVRADYTDPRIAKEGSYVETISASTHSAKSFATLATGRHPPRHGVMSFSDQLSDETPRIFGFDGIEARFVNSIFEYATREHDGTIDPIYSVLDVSPSGSNYPFSKIGTPFFLMERGPGGHAPYGDFDGTTTEYFSRANRANTQAIRADYRRSIELDADHFFDQLKRVRESLLAEDTLIVYTSDHGEMLGERGLLGHNGPMCPELVYVPTVFIHPDLPGSTVSEDAIHHVDLVRTLFDILDLGGSLTTEADGASLLQGFPEAPRPCFWSTRFFPDRIPGVSGMLSYEGVWDADGGHVWPNNSILSRLGIYLGKLLKSSKRTYMRQHPVSGFLTYARGRRTYGDPRFSIEEGESILRGCKQGSVQSRDIDLSEDARSHLRDLGYME